MTAIDDLHLAAEHYAEAQGKKAPAKKAAADDAQLIAAALDFAAHEGYADPIAPPSPGPIDTAYDKSVANLQRPQGSFGPVKKVTTLATLTAALSALRGGDDLLVSGVEIPGTINFPQKFSQYARVTFDKSCVFSGYNGGWVQKDNIYLPDTHYLQLIFEQGCKITNPKGNRNMAVFGGDHLVIDGFLLDGCGGTNFQSSPVNAPLSNFWYRGAARNCGNHLDWDPHSEKGSGVHGMYLGNGKKGVLYKGVVALYTYDHKGGAGDLQFGHDTSVCGPVLPKDVELYVKAKNSKFQSKTQTGGNATQVWGKLGTGIVYKVIEADDIMGKAFWCNAMTNPNADIRIMAGTATRCCQNPRWSRQGPWDKKSGVSYPNPTAMTPRP
jgi:hypothetical protein